MLSKIDFGKRSNRHPERGRGGVEESRRVTLKLSWRDPSTFVRDDRVRLRITNSGSARNRFPLPAGLNSTKDRATPRPAS